MDWGQRLRAALAELGWSIPKLAEEMGHPGDSNLEEKLYKYVDSKVQHPRGTMMADIAGAIGRTEQWLRNGDPTELAHSPSLTNDEHDNDNVNGDIANRTQHAENARIGGSVSLDHRVPAYGHAMGGVDGEFVLNGNKIADILAPPSLRNIPEAYAVYVAGDSMEPRYDAGMVVFVNPRMPVRRGDYVVAQVRGKEDEPELAYVKRFISRANGVLRLEQLNPPKVLEFTFDGPPDQFCTIHKIVFSGEVT